MNNFMAIPANFFTNIGLSLDLICTVIQFQKFTLKEGIKLRTRIEFIVQREIVTGLKYIQKTKRLAMSGK